MNEPEDNKTSHWSGSDASSSGASTGRTIGPGTVIDQIYQLGEKLGQGGMGEVFQCRHLVLNKEYAIKLLTVESDAGLWQRFQLEARAIAKLNHPNIVSIHNMGVHEGTTPYYVMDLIVGQTLAARLKKCRQLSQEESLRIFIQICHCLNQAHNRGIVHRDIKPANIMLTEDNQVKLLDFGLAKFANPATLAGLTSAQGLTAPGEIFGSPAYMSPEQTAGQTIDRRSDIYSTAASLFECLTGAPPLKGSTALKTLLKIQSEPAPSLATVGSGLFFSNDLEAAMARALQKDPRDRYQHIDEFGEDLRRVLQGRPLRATRPQAAFDEAEPAEKETAPRRQAKPVSAAIMVLTVGLTALAAVVLILHQREQTSNHKSATESASTAESNKAPFLVSTEGGRHFVFRNCPDPGTIVAANDIKNILHADAYGRLNLTKGQYPLLYASRELMHDPEQLNRFTDGALRGILLLGPSRQDARQCLKVISQWPHLTLLHLESTGLDEESIGYLGKLTGLRYLYLKDIELDTATLARLPLLQQLELFWLTTNKGARPVLQALANSKRLRYLNLDGSHLEPEDIKTIAKISNLQNLSLDFTDLDLNMLDQLTVLKKIETLSILANRSIGKNAIPVLRKFKALKTVYIDMTGWSQAEQKELKKLANVYAN